ncbi:MAG: hypothetical protein PHO48_02650, partial [Candidatus Gracilibacteria bacterium]|nr:hypothetical protein [Candidatus Gracilibacteria bacterium]MDD5179435.1 hypothetical protein [Candidatus Gracilibacteria bacterium]
RRIPTSPGRGSLQVLQPGQTTITLEAKEILTIEMNYLCQSLYERGEFLDSRFRGNDKLRVKISLT